jgi:hypothetical protein
LAGDWRVYLEILTQPGAKIAVLDAALNHHRRHACSVTSTTPPDVHIAEIARMQSITAKRLKIPAAARARQQDVLAQAKARLASPSAPTPRRGRVASTSPV